MIYVDGKPIYSPYGVKIVTPIIPESVETYPPSMEYGKDYRCGNKNAEGKGFTVDGMSEYMNSTHGEIFFFAVTNASLDLTDTVNGTSVGFTIDLGENKPVGAVQIGIWSVYYDTYLCADICEDGGEFTNIVSDIFIPGSTNGAAGMYYFNINATTRYIRIRQTSSWTKYRFVVRGVKVFSSDPPLNATIKVVSKEK